MRGNLGPLVSVLMTSFNREKYISQAIESVLGSTYSNFELIIVDDCSIDNTVSIARRYVERDSRVKLFINDTNLGDYSNRNKAAEYAHGIYLKYLDSDDLIMPWGLEIMVDCLEKFPESSIAISSTIGENRVYPYLLSSANAYRNYYYKSRILVAGPSAVILRKSLFDNLGGFSSENYISDTELWFRIVQYSPVVCLPPGLIYWREHDGQQIVLEKKKSGIEFKRFQLDISILTSENCPLDRSECADILRNLRNIKIRNTYHNILKFEIRKAIKNIKIYKFSIFDIIHSLKKNIVRSIID